MKEKTILKISLVIALLGLSFLFLYAEELDLNVVENVDTVELEEEVKLKGTVSRLTVKDKVAFIELEGKKVEKTDVILFNDEDLFLKEGDYVEIEGTVEEYNDKREVIANKVVLK